MEDKFNNTKMLPLISLKMDEELSKMIELVQSVKNLGILEKDQNVEILLKELSKNPRNTIIQNALAEHLKPYIIKNKLKPPVFKIPPKE
jgi:hypothetical protein